MKEIKIDVRGMTCQSCVTLVERSLKKLDGIQNAVVNLTTEKATVSFDETILDETKIVNTITKKGYPASLIKGKLLSFIVKIIFSGKEKVL